MKALYQPTPHSFSANDQLFPPFTWTPQKWVEPGFNPLYIHLTHAPLEPGSTRVLHPNSNRFWRWVEPVSKRVRGVRKNDRSRMNVNRCRNRSSAERSERGQYPKGAPGYPSQEDRGWECCAQTMECWPPSHKISFPFCLIPSSYNAI